MNLFKRLLCVLIGHRPNLHSVQVEGESEFHLLDFGPTAGEPSTFYVVPCLRCRVLMAVPVEERAEDWGPRLEKGESGGGGREPAEEASRA